MPIILHGAPVTNTLSVRVSLLNQGHLVASLDPQGAAVLNVVFDQIALYNPPYPPIVKNQNPAAAIGVLPIQIGFFSRGAGDTLFQYAQPGGVQTTVHFT